NVPVGETENSSEIVEPVVNDSLDITVFAMKFFDGYKYKKPEVVAQYLHPGLVQLFGRDDLLMNLNELFTGGEYPSSHDNYKIHKVSPIYEVDGRKVAVVNYS